jgi:VWFA-related protein
MFKIVFLSLALFTVTVSLSLPVFAQTPVAVTIRQIDKSQFPEISLFVSVEDPSSQISSRINSTGFAVTEGGTSVDLVSPVIPLGESSYANPISTVLTLDKSGSMEGIKIEDAKRAAIAYTELMGTNDQIAVIAFDDRVLKISDFTNDKGDLKTAISRIRADGQTAFFDAVDRGLRDLNPISGRTLVIAMTDGKDNESLIDFMGIARNAERLGIPVYTVALGTDAETTWLAQLANRSGGKYVFAPSSAELTELYSEIARGVQSEYKLTYISPRPSHDGRGRDITVTIADSGNVFEAIKSYNPGGVIPTKFTEVSSDPKLSLRAPGEWDSSEQAFLILLIAIGILLISPRLISTRLSSKNQQASGYKDLDKGEPSSPKPTRSRVRLAQEEAAADISDSDSGEPRIRVIE